MNINKRKCIGCLKTFDRNEMFKIMKKYDSGEIVLSPSNKDFGRSVYICKNKNCIDNAFKKGKINRLLKNFHSDKLKTELEKALTN